ncbi:LacI family DNA-binding transcriptional regulator [Breznakiella homolactica]|uniref:LacI family DNA-binding transcriptional regulator n=1 Tax=Breznakiella homolactica TaxID=2798577 RepID=A0A7T7XMV3_9SPIR|nr:LacI family DNA-binding transcriptional regulator [Breznakiella homolactica]QQO09142.1 LacI family transcriptional regulator [Breznakiella homolactica]
MVSIKDIAKQVGMSPSTVSRVINGKKYVNPEKRAEILRLIKETGYVPNKAARSMVMQRSFSVGIVIPDTFNMFQRQLFSIIERHLESFGYHTLFFFVKSDEASEEECLRRMKSEQLDGVILIQEIKNPRFYSYLLDMGLPSVCTTFAYDRIPSVHVDEEQAAFDGVMHLLNLGHREINMVNGAGVNFGLQRAEGYFKALASAGLPRDESRIVYVRSLTAESGMYGMRELLLRGGRNFSAVFAATDELAMGTIRVLRDEGIRVPEDVSVVGFDDIEISNYSIPRLTTIRQPLLEMGERTALMLHRSIVNRDAVESDAVLPYRLIIRESTARVG